jgi:hypothetical protein
MKEEEAQMSIIINSITSTLTILPGLTFFLKTNCLQSIGKSTEEISNHYLHHIMAALYY